MMRLIPTHARLLALTLAVAGLALWLRVHGLGHESLWLDEGYTWQRSSLPVPALIAHAIRGHHNPSYFILIHYWLMLGDDEFMLRLPSAIAGALAAGATVWLGHVLHGAAAGFVAGSLFALAPLQIRFGQEARMYSLLSLSATIAMLGLVWLVKHPERAALPILGTARLWRQQPASDVRSGACAPAWAAYALGTIGSLYLHNTAVVFAASAALAMLGACAWMGRQGLRTTANFVAVNLLVSAAFCLYLGTELKQAKVFAKASFWASFPTTRELGNIARELYLMTAKLESPLALMLATAALLGLWELRREGRVAFTLLALGFVGPGLLLLVSLYKPIFGVRLLLWVAGPLFALIGAGVAGVRPSLAPAFVAAAALLVWPTLAQQYARVEKEPWREVVKAIEARAQPNARVVAASSEEALMLQYYRERRRQPLGSFRIERARRRKMPEGIGDAPQVFLLDRKDGRRAARARRKLEASGFVTRTQAFRNLRLLELTRREAN